jgi:hypothetical protein
MSAAPADRLGRVLAIAGVLVAIATIIGAIFVMGTPAEQRRVRIDERRLDDLRTLVGAIRTYAKVHGLPQDLATIAREPGTRLPLEDPEGRGPYEYARIDASTFHLCAVFTTDTATSTFQDPRFQEASWKHGAGRQCFVRKHRAGSDGE